ncbi:MAG: hypothetical protein AAF989_14845 [Planctomycetota bacterium]
MRLSLILARPNSARAFFATFALVATMIMGAKGSAEEAGTTSHSFLGFGKANRVTLIGEDGLVKWKLDLPASDGWNLANGNVLAAIYPCVEFPGGGVVEVNPKTDDRVFTYQGTQKEISTVVSLSGHRYLITELGAEPRAIVVNADGAVEQTTALDCQVENTHMQTRMLRVLPNGNYLVPHLLDFAVKEYVPETGQVVHVLTTDERGREKRDWPFTAIRLPSGNTLIGCTNGNRVIELDPKGNIAWSVSNDDLGEKLIDDACGVQRLPNGNTVISSYHAKGKATKLLEVTPEKEIVWRFSGMKAGFHHFQILTTNGKKLGGASLR